jgi:hypothetical protein
VTIVSPVTGENFGPGMFGVAGTDLIGPLPSDSIWTWTITSPPNELFVLEFVRGSSSHLQSDIIYYGTPTQIFKVRNEPVMIHGAAAQLVVALDSASTSLHEEATVQIVLDRQTGVAVELQRWMELNTPPAGTGLTEEEHNAVLQTNVGVIAMSGIDVIDLVGDMVQAIGSSRPLAFGSLSDPVTISGDGEMPDELVLLPKWGIYWVATTIPAGLTHFHGQSEEYSPRLIQWRTVHEVGGIEMVTELVDFQTHGELWRFAQQNPRRVEYSIIPGVVVQARWWQFP